MYRANSMERSPVDLMPRSELIGYIASWITAFVLIAGSIMALEFRQLESRFDAIANVVTAQVTQQLEEQQSGLESFAHSLSSQPVLTPSMARYLARSLHQHAPDLYMFAIASRVAPDQRLQFEQRMTAEESRGFRIHPPADAGAGANTSPANLYPVALLEPELPEARGLLGLDLAREPSVLRGRLSGQAEAQGMSRPFMLGNGMGYLLYHAIDPGFSHQSATQPQAYSHYALLAVRADALIGTQLTDEPGLSLQLMHTDVQGEAQALLFETLSDTRLALPIPAFTRSHQFTESLQPLLLKISYQPTWQALDRWHLAGMLGGLCLLMLQVGWVAQRVLRTRRQLLEQQKSLYNKAHFDHLTGLPNTNLLLDRLEQAIRSALRTSSRVAVFFLDLDDFKQVNDTWGHEVGDQLLIQIGVRLRESMRSEDTVARIHGDEFVILIPVLHGERQLNKIRAKLEALFELPFKVGEIVLVQSGSFGLAVYPEDADDAEGLLGLADRQMYLRKQSRNTYSGQNRATG